MRAPKRFSGPVLAVLLAGCGAGTVEENAPPADEGTAVEAELGKPIDASLAELLARPRSELAALTDEWASRVQLMERGRREGRVTYALLPEERFPLVVPVLREAKYSAAAGVSLPPYVAEGTKDAGLALHLARYGDAEAARRLADPTDGDTLAQIEASRGARNYPVEWSRLVGIMLHSAQVRLATGDSDGARELIGLHRQLREVLDAQAARGPLGADLLSRGRGTLGDAAAAWRAAKRTGPADEAEAALAAWGDVPPLAPAVAPGAGTEAVRRVFGGAAQGRVLPAVPAARALDLLGLPLPADGVQTALACLDPEGRLSEVLIAYRGGLSQTFPQPRHLASCLEDHGLDGEKSKEPGLIRRTYRLGDLACEVAVVPHGHAIGALVRLADDRAPPPPGSLPRDFGAAHLDRSFEQNRLRLAPEHHGDVVRAERATALAAVAHPLQGVPLTQAVLERDGEYDVASRLLFRFATDPAGRAALHQTALGLWAAGGPARVRGVEDGDGGYLAFVWEDGATRWTLRLPHSPGRAMELEAADRRGPDAAASRAAAARDFDRAERAARTKAGKPLARLPRHLDSEDVELGMTRAEVLQGLPQGQSVLRHNFADGLWVVVTGEAERNTAFTPRQLFVRFGPDGRAVELRTRYGEGSGGGNWVQAVVNDLKRRCGAAAEVPGPSAWADLPPRAAPAAVSRWQDDVTLITCRRDAWGVEVTLRAAPPEDGPDPLPPLVYLPRGPGDVSLGDAREEVMKRAGDRPPLPDGALVLAPASPVRYDTLLVWFDGDRVARVVARHVQAGPAKPTPAQMAQQLTEAWGREARALGWPRRQDFAGDKVLQGLGWHDDRTRVRMFWQESQNGPPRLYTEWR
jgi:hypothetical protein